MFVVGEMIVQRFGRTKVKIILDALHYSGHFPTKFCQLFTLRQPLPEFDRILSTFVERIHQIALKTIDLR